MKCSVCGLDHDGLCYKKPLKRLHMTWNEWLMSLPRDAFIDKKAEKKYLAELKRKRDGDGPNQTTKRPGQDGLF